MAEITGYLERATLLLHQGRPKEAAEWVRKLLEKDPENDHALSVLAQCYLDSKEFDKSLEVIQQAIQLDPAESHYYYLAAFCYYLKDQGDKSRQFLLQAIQMNPYSPGYFGLMAYLDLGRNDFKGALANADQGLRIDAENITCLNARSTALNKLKMTDEAIATMENALAKDPDNEYTHVTIGWNYLEKGRHRESASHFREALRINPNHQNAKAGLKEALKSRIGPYRWLLQYAFWLRNKGKTFRWLFIIGVFVGVRVIVGLSQENAGFEKIGLFVSILYFLFVATSWIINPLANIFLLLNREGKYALTESEKWSAIAFASCLLVALGMAITIGLAGGKDLSTNWYICCAIMASLSVPTGHMHFPLKIPLKNSFARWLEIGLLFFALASLALTILAPGAAMVAFTLYLICFVAFTWTRAF